MTRLSAREMEIARLIADDLADKEIAQVLMISIHTVNAHLARIAEKIGAARGARRRVIRRWVESAERETQGGGIRREAKRYDATL